MSEETCNPNSSKTLSQHKEDEPALSLPTVKESPQPQQSQEITSSNTNYPVITNISQINRSNLTNTDVVEIEVPTSDEAVQIKSYTSINSLPGASFPSTPSSQFSTMSSEVQQPSPALSGVHQHQTVDHSPRSSCIVQSHLNKTRKPNSLPQPLPM